MTLVDPEPRNALSPDEILDLETIEDLMNKTLLVENVSLTDDLNPLHFQVKKLQKLLIFEQEKYSKLQKQLQDSENQRLELISSTNKEIFSLTTQFTKLRSDYEKNEAIRRSLEYELTIVKNSLNKEKNLTTEKDKLCEENNKFYQEQIKNLKKENLNLATSLENFQEKFLKKESEAKKLLIINQEQENLINSFKEESNLNKDINEKLTSEIQIFREKLDKSYKHLEQLARKNQSLEDSLKRENDHFREIKLKFEAEQRKNQELIQTIEMNEDKKVENDINLEKLLDQLKENRKELLEEQIRSKDTKERFKIIETELKLSNSELSKKLEEKTSTIKNLSDQLNNCEKELISIKNELKKTSVKQLEFDKIYEICSKDIKQIIKLFISLSNDVNYQEFLKNIISSDKLKLDENQNCTQAQYMIKNFDNLYQVLQEFFNYIIKNKGFNSEKLKADFQANEKRIKELEIVNQRFKSDIELLRNERDAIEEVVESLTNECDTLKLSLQNQYEVNDSLKNKINSMSKKLKENEHI
ncbi:unnamed protein product [Brachionus calyciflorus]|uniref:Uncharacterized protein n=1 Tax=Brachionus calyciflorus TaxID=104777 RepID=A0A814C9W2_9BILA|nr:unnamed protein product [Brachionus calyciflorus]